MKWIVALYCVLPVLLLLLFAKPVHSQDGPSGETDQQGKPKGHRELSPSEIIKLPIEELMNINVLTTTVFKRPEKANETPAAISVLTGEEIRRSGATHIAEALRTVPGVHVARSDSSTYAIGIRGFQDIYNNRVLVMVDGRSVYSPLFSGVLWDVQDMMMEDIDRIEVVRGPAGTLYETHAINGVINVVSKSAKETQGWLVTAGAGNEERVSGSVRYGTKLGEHLYIRGYAKGFDRDDSAVPNGRPADDQWHQGRAGFRMDWEASARDLVTVQGDGYVGRENGLYTLPIMDAPYSRTAHQYMDVSGGNLLGRWSHTISEGSDLQLQTYYDHTVRDLDLIREERHTFDLNFDYHVHLGSHAITCGAGYRLTSDRIRNSFMLQYDPDRRTLNTPSFFVQDEITVVPDHLRLTVGSKFERNDYTGFQFQPSVRLLWTPNQRHTLWAGVSRAVTTPSRSAEELRINGAVFGPPAVPFQTLVARLPNTDLKGSEIVSYELGYRVRPIDTFSLDVAGYVAQYPNLYEGDNLLPSLEALPSPPHLLMPFRYENDLDGIAYGGEVSAHWQATDWWHLQAGYTFWRLELERERGSAASFGDESRSPRQQFSLRSSMDLPHHVELDVGLRYVDRIPLLGVPAYLLPDVRVGWHPIDCFEISLIGQCLTDDRHPEFMPTAIQTQTTEVQRSLFARITLRF